jgi:hypothetical protein
MQKVPAYMLIAAIVFVATCISPASTTFADAKDDQIAALQGKVRLLENELSILKQTIKLMEAKLEFQALVAKANSSKPIATNPLDNTLATKPEITKPTPNVPKPNPTITTTKPDTTLSSGKPVVQPAGEALTSFEQITANIPPSVRGKAGSAVNVGAWNKWLNTNMAGRKYRAIKIKVDNKPFKIETADEPIIFGRPAVVAGKEHIGKYRVKVKVQQGELILIFDKSESAKVEALKRGAVITTTGTITYLKRAFLNHIVVVADCKIE